MAVLVWDCCENGIGPIPPPLNHTHPFSEDGVGSLHRIVHGGDVQYGTAGVAGKLRVIAGRGARGKQWCAVPQQQAAGHCVVCSGCVVQGRQA